MPSALAASWRCAPSYRIQSERVESLSDLTRAVKDALSAAAPRLIEISQRRLADS